jgi:hypothetical protein
MIEIKQKSRSSLKTYIFIQSLVLIILLGSVYFSIFPKMKETIREVAPEQVKTMENKISYIISGSLIFIFLINIYVWRIGEKLNEEKKEPLAELEINPNSVEANAKLQSIEKKERNYFSLIEPIFFIIIGIIIGLISIFFFQPIYSMLGKIK